MQQSQAKPQGESELSKLLEEEKNFLFKPYPREWKGTDPVGFPYESMKRLQLDLSCKMSQKANDKTLVEKLSSLEKSIGKVSIAYAIIAYPFCKQQDVIDLIKSDLTIDTACRERTKVELNDEELELVGKLVAVRELPFDPEKRVYEYSEVSGYSPPRKREHSIFDRAVHNAFLAREMISSAELGLNSIKKYARRFSASPSIFPFFSPQRLLDSHQPMDSLGGTNPVCFYVI